MSTSKKKGLIKYKTIRWGISLLLYSFLAGCTHLVDSDSNEEKMSSLEDYSIKTDQAVYLVEEGYSPLKITYEYTNDSKQDLYPVSCREVPMGGLEKLVDGEWVRAFGPICQLLYLRPITIRPGKSNNATVEIHPSTWDPSRKNASWHVGDIEGTYRVSHHVYFEWNEKKRNKGTLPPPVTVVSNTFEIRMEP